MHRRTGRNVTMRKALAACVTHGETHQPDRQHHVECVAREQLTGDDVLQGLGAPVMAALLTTPMRVHDPSSSTGPSSRSMTSVAPARSLRSTDSCRKFDP